METHEAIPEHSALPLLLKVMVRMLRGQTVFFKDCAYQITR